MQVSKKKKGKATQQVKTADNDQDKSKATAKPVEEVKKQKVVKDVTVKVDEKTIV